MNWYWLALLSLVLMGSQRFLYKVSAERQCNTAWTTFSFMATVSALSTVFFLLSDRAITNLPYLLFISLINSASFLLATLTHIEALKHIPTGVVYPLIRLSLVLVVVFSILYFKDPLSLRQVAGIVTALAVIFILTRDLHPSKGTRKSVKKGMLFIFVSLIAGAVASISSKFAALHTEKMAYIAVSYTAATLFSFLLRKRFETGHTGAGNRDAVIIGMVMGLINLAGYYAFLMALAAGPLSIIVSIGGMHFVIAVVLSRLIYHEKLTRWRILGILFTAVSIILLR